MPPDGGLHVQLTEIIDGLLTRIASHTSALRSHGGAPDDGDAATARMLLSDLRTLTSLWQSLARGVNHQIESAVIELQDAKNAANRRSIAPEE